MRDCVKDIWNGETCLCKLFMFYESYKLEYFVFGKIKFVIDEMCVNITTSDIFSFKYYWNTIFVWSAVLWISNTLSTSTLRYLRGPPPPPPVY